MTGEIGISQDSRCNISTTARRAHMVICSAAVTVYNERITAMRYPKLVVGLSLQDLLVNTGKVVALIA